jgi:microcystin degradation protein MlrC
MKIENFGPAEADLLKSIREFLPHAPIVCSLDMHGTITPGLMRYGDAFVGYKTAPHIDTFETGVHAANMLLKSLRTGKKLVSAYRRIPMMLAGEKSETAAEPMLSLMEELRKTEKLPGIEAASYLIAHVWSDTEYNSMYSVVTSLDDRDAAEAAAVKLAAVFWARRKDFKFRNEHYDAAESLRVAYEAVFEKHQHPVFVSDSGDNPTAGATGDATELLERIMDTMDTVDKLPTPFLYSGFYDAPAVRACIAAGVGAKLDITVGGNWDTVNGKKIPLTVEVKKIVKAYGSGSADIALVSHRNLLISLTSKHIGFGDPNLLPALGIKAEEYYLAAVKLGYLEPCFREIAARAIMATTSGASKEVLENLPFKKVIRPIYPLDKDMEFTPV